MAKTLTALDVQNAKPRRRGSVPVLTEISDGGCKSLRLVIHPTGSKSWIVRYRFGGRTRKLTLGPAVALDKGTPNPKEVLTLTVARTRAAEAQHQIEQGIDPGAEKLAQQKPLAPETFAKVAEDCYAREKVEKNLRSGDQQLGHLRRLVFPTLGKLPIASIRRSDVVKLLDRISVEQGPSMADAVLSIISKVMKDHAARTDDYAPVIIPGMRRTRPKERARSRVLDDDELRRVWAASSEGIFGSFVRFLLLTACRRNEAVFMLGSELGNGNGMVWTLPKERNKTKVELIRPLSRAAQVVLASLPRAGNAELVFQKESGRKVAGNVAPMKQAFDQACRVQGWVLHDLRRTARSLMSRAGVPDNHAERCLGHVIAGVKGVYDRHRYVDEMRAAYERLATLIENIVEPQQTTKVVQMRGE
jgi:integrase